MTLLETNHCEEKTLSSELQKNRLFGMNLVSLPHTVGSVLSPSTSMGSSVQSFRPLINDYGPPSMGYLQGMSSNQAPQSKYAELLTIIEELGKDIRPTYAGSKSAMERLKR
eukprot:g41280.t1